MAKTQAVAVAVVEAAPVVEAIDPSVVKAANVVIGAVGGWSELMGSQGSKYFTTMTDGASKALVSVGPSIESGRTSWQSLNPTRNVAGYTAEVWVGQVAAQRPDGWTPSAIDRQRLDILFTLATNDHSADSVAHYVAVSMADIDGRYGVADLMGYVDWLPQRASYQETNDKGVVVDLDVMSAAAVQAAKDAREASKATQAEKAAINLTGHVWDTIAPAANYSDDAARDEHLAKLLHDFTHYVTSTLASHGDETYVRGINRSVSNAVKTRRQNNAVNRAAK